MHLYTASVTELNAVIKNSNYHLEGVSCYLYDPATTPVPAGTIPLYRLYSSQWNGARYYTIDQMEYSRYIGSGNWKDEGIAGYVYGSLQPNTTLFYKLQNPTTYDWICTVDEVEKGNLTSSGSWMWSGAAGYVYTLTPGLTGTGTVPFYRLSNA
jgi:hypothetical protein